MEMIQQREKVRALEGYFNLRKNPEEIEDINLLERGLNLLEKASEITGEDYVFKRIQQSGMGAYIDLVPRDYKVNERVNFIIGVYDQNFFVGRLRYLKGEKYQ